MTKRKLYLQARNEHYKRNIKLILSRLDIAIGLLAGFIYLSAVYYLSIWRW